VVRCVTEGPSSVSRDWTSAVTTDPNSFAQTTIGLLARGPNGAEPLRDENGDGMYDEGEIIEAEYPEAFRDDNSNGVWDSGEYFLDQNQNEQWDDVNGVWDGPCQFTTATCNSPGGIVVFQTGAFLIN